MRVGPRLTVTHHSFMREGSSTLVVSSKPAAKTPASVCPFGGRPSSEVATVERPCWAVTRVWWCWVRQIRAGRRHVDPARSGRRRFVFVDPARSPPRRPDAMTAIANARSCFRSRVSIATQAAVPALHHHYPLFITALYTYNTRISGVRFSAGRKSELARRSLLLLALRVSVTPERRG